MCSGLPHRQIKSLHLDANVVQCQHWLLHLIMAKLLSGVTASFALLEYLSRAPPFMSISLSTSFSLSLTLFCSFLKSLLPHNSLSLFLWQTRGTGRILIDSPWIHISIDSHLFSVVLNWKCFKTVSLIAWENLLPLVMNHYSNVALEPQIYLHINKTRYYYLNVNVINETAAGPGQGTIGLSYPVPLIKRSVRISTQSYPWIVWFSWFSGSTLRTFETL